jgi:hypothetical protein
MWNGRAAEGCACITVSRPTPNARGPFLSYVEAFRLVAGFCFKICHERLVADRAKSLNKQRSSLDDFFKGRQFQGEIIIHCVRWYLQYKLSYRDLIAMMAERGVAIAPSTILRLGQRYAPNHECSTSSRPSSLPLQATRSVLHMELFVAGIGSMPLWRVQ